MLSPASMAGVGQNGLEGFSLAEDPTLACITLDCGLPRLNRGDFERGEMEVTSKSSDQGLRACEVVRIGAR